MSSLPKNTGSAPRPPSSSSSKQSLRRPSSGTQQLPSRPRPIDRRSSAEEVDSHAVTDASPAPSHEAIEYTGSPNYETDAAHPDVPPSTTHSRFQPFFTLIEDAHSAEYFHPTVHYIFSDDDTDIITEAAFRVLEPGQDKGASALQRNSHPHEQDEAYTGEAELGNPEKPSLLPPPIPGVRENYIILDMEPSPSSEQQQSIQSGGGDVGPTSTTAAGGVRSISTSPATQLPPPAQYSAPFRVTAAHSLTPAWQVLDTAVLPAPTFENGSSGEQAGNSGIMLKIQGTAGLPAGIKERERGTGSQRLEDMMDQFAKRMRELRHVIEAGEPPTSAAEEDQHNEDQHDSPGLINQGDHPEQSLLPDVI
ncbi:hypothetical protein ASPZODRAFT_463418 [Penicilliopsis zonata CBS 506.65]|uniref:Anaphase-promoting complex subunit 11 RING-H2 finger domain-containing protein n=1 Tax=Penicilliopsis zonata CBS 506.65 TaxID=1073090 RepID=A0A1L9SX73_9EURO|nr:hypothetical protein ASPZODRAFT_463418 [Penicilliopsis zonata CBS 506.65]OJJ51759.1 hypothetical protein ASPZODRAFT_463418 [Penicilliopsis zonata CBS 506.65]